MMTFKDVIRNDVKVTFMNPREFSDIHLVNGRQMPVQIDDNEEIEREKRFSQSMDGIYVNQRLIYVAVDDFGPIPKQGSILKLDDRTFRVSDAIEESGVYSITLEANRA